MSKFKFLLAIFLVAILSGCSLPGIFSSAGAQGGFFKSSDFGENWEHKNSTTVNGKKTEISGVNTKEIAVDPKDSALVYLATRESGLFVSENGGEDWRQIFSTGFVSSVALDPGSRGVIYIAVGTKIYKSIDQGKEWRTIYLENRTGVEVSQVAVDPKDSTKLVMGTSNGEIFQSSDAGESWKLSFETKDNVRKILINKKDSKIIYVATLKRGIFRSVDHGKTWRNLLDNYTKFGDATRKYRYLAFDPGVDDGLFFVSDFGIIRSVDGGEIWEDLKILTPNNSATINIFAVNPKNNKQIYYAVQNIVYRSFDGGKQWLSAKAPTDRTISFMLVSPENPSVIFMGVANASSKPFFFL